MSYRDEERFARQLLTRFEAERKHGLQDHMFTVHEAALIAAGLRLVVQGLQGTIAPAPDLADAPPPNLRVVRDSDGTPVA